MAYTKIIPIRYDLQRCVNYTTNPDKTETDGLKAAIDYTLNGDKTAHQVYVSGFNCDPNTAASKMQRTRENWGKAAGRHVLGYHVIQSFLPGEVTPEQAHKIGCEFVRRALPDYEVTVSTHLDREHLHNHIVFNAVSFADGHRFRDDYRGYYQGIRAPSDRLCREHGLSIIDPDGKGKSYAERSAEKQGKPTMRSLVRADVDKALDSAISWPTFVISMQHMGYTVRYGPGVKYATVKHRTSQRSIRLKSLGAGYTEAALREKLAHKTAYKPLVVPTRKSYSCRRKVRYRGSFSFLPTYKITGFMALYYHYVCLFRRARKGNCGIRTHYLLREETIRFERYVEQAKFLWDNHIETDEDLNQFQAQTQSQMDRLTADRAVLYRLKAAAPPEEKEQYGQQISAITAELRPLRQSVRRCDAIREDALRLRQKMQQVREAEQQRREPQMNRKSERRFRQ